MAIKIIKDKISQEELKSIAQDEFGDMIKAVVDIKKGILALGGELHADAEQVLLADGSAQSDVWGINIYPDKKKEDMIEFSSLINIRPKIGNRSIIIENPEVREKINSIVNKLVF